MGISILAPVLDIKDGEVIDWILKLSTCRGMEKSAPAEYCIRCAQKTVDMLLENRQRVLTGIRDRLNPHGFDASDTYRDWIIALQEIIHLSTDVDGDCLWSAPPHPEDMKPDDWKRLMLALERKRAELNEPEA